MTIWWRGAVGGSDRSKKWWYGLAVFLVSTAIASHVFYNVSGIDRFLLGTQWHIRTVEFLSTSGWAIIISGISILPFALTAFYWRSLFSVKPLLGSILTTWLTTILALFVYFAYMHLLGDGGVDNAMRGKIVGAGLRSGMFTGLYFSVILSATNGKKRYRSAR